MFPETNDEAGTDQVSPGASATDFVHYTQVFGRCMNSWRILINYTG